MLAEWGPRGRRPRRVRPVEDVVTGNAIYDGVDDDGPAMVVLLVLGVVFVVVAIGLVLL